jgi:hypothetical protein
MDLTIPEKLFILAIDDDRGNVASFIKDSLQYGLAGGVLAELALAKKIQLVEGRLAIVDAASMADPLLHGVLATIAAEPKPRKLERWIEKIGSKKLEKQVASKLAECNVISIEEKRILWIIPCALYPQKDASVKYWIKEHLRALFLAAEPAEPSDIALLSLLAACNMLRLVFTRDERKAASKKVKAIVKGEIFGETVAQLLQDIEISAAAVVAVVAATAN